MSAVGNDLQTKFKCKSKNIFMKEAPDLKTLVYYKIQIFLVVVSLIGILIGLNVTDVREDKIRYSFICPTVGKCSFICESPALQL